MYCIRVEVQKYRMRFGRISFKFVKNKNLLTVANFILFLIKETGNL